MMWIQIFVTVFVFFVLYRIYRNIRDYRLSSASGILWSLLWVSVLIVFWSPALASWLAFQLGVGRGSDLIIYGAVLLMLYLLYRVFVRLERIEREITILARTRAINHDTPEDSRRRSDRKL